MMGFVERHSMTGFEILHLKMGRGGLHLRINRVERLSAKAYYTLDIHIEK